MNILTLAKELNVTQSFITLITSHLFDSTDEVDDREANMIRLICDPTFIRKFNAQVNSAKTAAFKKQKQNEQFNDWITTVDLSGMSAKEIEEIAPGGPYKGLKQISMLMSANGYESKVKYLGNDKQGRRWFKPEVSFI